MFYGVDPMAEERYWLSPYQYAQNSPIIRIDPDGMLDDLYITGDQADPATKELQQSTSLTLTRDAITGKISATGSAKTAEDKKLLEVINSKTVDVKVTATSKKTTSANEVLPDGAFMGNKVNGSKAESYQEVNSASLKANSKYNGKPGADMLHEVTESSEGALISIKAGKSSPRAGQPGSVYSQAHAAATKQSGTNFYMEILDKNGNPSNVLYKSGKANYFVDDGVQAPLIYFTYP